MQVGNACDWSVSHSKAGTRLLPTVYGDPELIGEDFSGFKKKEKDNEVSGTFYGKCGQSPSRHPRTQSRRK